MFERQSALSKALTRENSPASGQHVRIGEILGWALTQIAGFPRSQLAFAATARRILEEALPTQVGEVAGASASQVFMTGRSQFWILTRSDSTLPSELVRAFTPQIGAVTSLSHSRTRFFIEGLAARKVLSSAIALDLDSKVFRIGRFALTGWHHTPILLHRTDEFRYEIYAMRTFAQWVWESVLDAALPYGYDVVGEGSYTAGRPKHR